MFESRSFETSENTEGREVKSPFERDIKTSLKYLYERIRDEQPQALIFLDKSARPLSWGLEEIFRLKRGKSPEVKYLNVGTEKTDLPLFRPNLSEKPGKKTYLPFSSTKVFEAIKNLPEFEKLKKYYAGLRGQCIMVIDETISSGNTLKIAAEIITALIGEKPDNVLCKNPEGGNSSVLEFSPTTNGWKSARVSEEGWNTAQKTKIILEHGFINFKQQTGLHETKNPSALLANRAPEEFAEFMKNGVVDEELLKRLDPLAARKEMKKLAQELVEEI